MNCTRKLLVVSSSQRPNLRMPRKWNDSLPFIKEIPGADDDPGIIENADGGLRCVLRVSGHNLTFLESEHQQVAATFHKVLGCIDSFSELQFLTVNRPIDPDAYVDAFREMAPKENPYLDWYADYTSKWFRRVCEVSVVPRKDFYIILTEKESSNQRKRLKRRTADVMKVLRQGGLNAQVLTRADVRQVLYSCMRLSYATGLTEQPVETLSNSSLPKVAGTASKNHLRVDGQFVSSHAISDLPSKAKVGWLMNLVVAAIPSTFSLHVRKAGSKFSDFYELSLYASTFADSADKLEQQRDQLKLLFKQEGALLSPEHDQFSAWISTLPLGIDSGGIAHCVPVDTAEICWPFFTEHCGSTAGFPLGFARSSREPIFLRPSEMSNASVLASSRKDLTFFHSILTVRMLTSDCHVLYIDSGEHEMTVLLDVLGPNLTNDLQVKYGAGKITQREFSDLDRLLKTPGSYLDVKLSQKLFVEDASLTLMNVPEVQSQADRNRFRHLIQSWSKFYGGTKTLVIVISDVNQFKNAERDSEMLLNLFELAKRKGITIIVGGLTSKTSSLNELTATVNEHADMKIVLPMTQKGQALAAKMFSLSQGETRILSSFSKDERKAKQVNCFLRTSENRGVVRITPSPMDYWLCSSVDRAHREKINKMKVGLKEKNPKLSNTDVSRQAVYYLGLQS